MAAVLSACFNYDPTEFSFLILSSPTAEMGFVFYFWPKGDFVENENEKIACHHLKTYQAPRCIRADEYIRSSGS